MKYNLLLQYFILLYNFSIASSIDTSRVIREQGWIEKMNHTIGIKISLDNNYESFRVSTTTSDISLYPNISSVLNFGLYYRFLRVGFGVAPSFLPGNGDTKTRGDTRSFYLDVSAYPRHWYQNFSYSVVRGYYLENTVDYIPNWSPGDPYILLPDLYFTGFSGTTGYYLNPRLSLKSLTIQTERQLKSAGSFSANLNYRFYTIDDRSTPSPGGATQKSNNIEITLGTGYIYNFVIGEKFYASMAALPAIAFINTKLFTRYESEEFENTQHNWGFRWDGRGALGYNGRKFFGGLYITASGLEYKQENTTAINFDTRVYYQLFIGIRINAPGFMNNTFDWLCK
ncbi:MAG TPA: DUF4421 family protein [Bacteroidales bacterium]|nr:DUF4421 family protein [Bacteroidales bacterium]HRX97209.1 DUF4421 family protein [Bacteroidales bacterium]